jgi:CBS domain-containing protein
MQAFLSYSHFDDAHNANFATKFRDALIQEVQSQTGERILVFQDRDISWGQNWGRRIEHALNEANFLIPVVTPSFLKSDVCINELKTFLEHERKLQRDDLILPLYFIDVTESHDATENELVSVLFSHQYVDWRKLRFKTFKTAAVRKALAEVASQIRKAMDRTKQAVEQVKEEFGRSMYEFGDRPVSEIIWSSEIMSPRPDIVAVEASLSIAEARKVIVEFKHTWLPIYRTYLDNIEGLLYAPDLLAYSEPNQETLPVSTCAREVYYVPETKPIAQLLDDMLSQESERTPPMAIVIDEYGGVSGLVTMTDILRELFGTKNA